MVQLMLANSAFTFVVVVAVAITMAVLTFWLNLAE